MGYNCPAPVLGCALRITRLDACGRPLDPLATNSRIATKQFTMVESSPENEDSKEIMLQNACTEISTYFKTQKRTKFFSLKLTLSKVHLPTLEMLLDTTLLEDADNPGDFKGFWLANGLTQPTPNPKMIEVEGNNAELAECGDAGNAYVRHIWGLTKNWAIDDTLTINNSDPFTVVLSGEAFANPNWFPSFPNEDFPSWVPGGGDPDGTPIGPAPAVIPANVTADPFTLDDQASAQEGGPYGMITTSQRIETLWECNYIDSGS